MSENTEQTQRDELARTLFIAGYDDKEGAAIDWEYLKTKTLKPEIRALVNEYKAADAILAAGYSKPRQVSTVEELDALPVGSVVILRDSKGDPHPAQKGEHGWRLPFVDGFWTAEKLLAGSESAELVAG